MTRSDIDPAPRVAAIVARYRDGIVEAMRAALDRPGVGHVGLMRYHLGWQDVSGNVTEAVSGKMLRPVLVLLSAEAVGSDASRAMPAAAAIELLHNFTLIHDDIEDGSDSRHGRETLWRVAGVPQAINAGDGMLVLAQRTLLSLADTGVAPDRVLAAARLLDDACVELCEGQYLDIGFESRDRVSLAEYETMIAGKTGALLGASMAIGAIAGGADDATTAAFGECGRLLGRAFQIQDDVLGIWGDDRTGKPVADDIRSRKRSYPIAWAFEHLRGEAASTLGRIYGSTSAMSESNVEKVVALLNEADVARIATDGARGWSERSVELLRTLQLDGERRADLEAIAAFSVQRSA